MMRYIVNQQHKQILIKVIEIKVHEVLNCKLFLRCSMCMCISHQNIFYFLHIYLLVNISFSSDQDVLTF